MYSIEDGKLLRDIARKSIVSVFENKDYEPSEEIKKRFSKEQGGFVTLEKDNKLRGCIGYIEPIFPLWKTISNVAIAAAFKDIRFEPVRRDEFENIIVEISILSVPKLIEVSNPEEYPEKIKIGRDGLIIKSRYGSGVLLPQVPVEWGWDVREFLENLSLKAGLESNAWRDINNKIYAFQAEIFKEKEPNGEITRVENNS